MAEDGGSPQRPARHRFGTESEGGQDGGRIAGISDALHVAEGRYNGDYINLYEHGNRFAKT